MLQIILSGINASDIPTEDLLSQMINSAPQSMSGAYKFNHSTHDRIGYAFHLKKEKERKEKKKRKEKKEKKKKQRTKNLCFKFPLSICHSPFLSFPSPFSLLPSSPSPYI